MEGVALGGSDDEVDPHGVAQWASSRRHIYLANTFSHLISLVSAFCTRCVIGNQKNQFNYAHMRHRHVLNTKPFISGWPVSVSHLDR